MKREEKIQRARQGFEREYGPIGLYRHVTVDYFFGEPPMTIDVAIERLYAPGVDPETREHLGAAIDQAVAGATIAPRRLAV